MADTKQAKAFTVELPIATIKQLRAYAKKNDLKIKACLASAVNAWLASVTK